MVYSQILKTDRKWTLIMQLDLDNSPQNFQLRSYKPGSIVVNDTTYNKSIIISADNINHEWQPQSVDELQASDWKTIIDKAPEILLIGTGSKHKIIPGELLANLYDAKIAVEVMSTAAACRSYRLLASDNRSVTAALLIN